MAVIQLFLLDGFVNHLSLDVFHLVNRQQRCSARFDLHVLSNVLKNIGDSKTFFLSKLNF